MNEIPYTSAYGVCRRDRKAEFPGLTFRFVGTVCATMPCMNAETTLTELAIDICTLLMLGQETNRKSTACKVCWAMNDHYDTEPVLHVRWDKSACLDVSQVEALCKVFGTIFQSEQYLVAVRWPVIPWQIVQNPPWTITTFTRFESEEAVLGVLYNRRYAFIKTLKNLLFLG